MHTWACAAPYPHAHPCCLPRCPRALPDPTQVVQFFTNSTAIDPAALPRKLNSLLPHDIRVRWMSQTAPDFSVTVSALRKVRVRHCMCGQSTLRASLLASSSSQCSRLSKSHHRLLPALPLPALIAVIVVVLLLLPHARHSTTQTYHYRLDTGACHDPLALRYSHHVPQPLDTAAMAAAAALLVGRHDFSQFSNRSPEGERRNPVKTLERLQLVPDTHAGGEGLTLQVRRGVLLVHCCTPARTCVRAPEHACMHARVATRAPRRSLFPQVSTHQNCRAATPTIPAGDRHWLSVQAGAPHDRRAAGRGPRPHERRRRRRPARARLIPAAGRRRRVARLQRGARQGAAAAGRAVPRGRR